MIREDLTARFPMPDDTGWSTGVTYWVEVAALAGALDAAPLLRERLLPYHEQIVTTSITFHPAVCHYLGVADHLAGRHDDAERWFAEALQIHQQLRSPPLAAETQAAWAAMLADRNEHDDHARARVMAHTAFDAAVAGGYGYIEADARVVLDRLA